MPYMSASIQFLVSDPHSQSASGASVSSGFSSSLWSGDSTSIPLAPGVVPESWRSTASRTSLWALNSAVAGVTLPPLSPSEDCNIDLEPTPQVNCLHTLRFLQDCRLSLIHIPLQLYPHFVRAILSLILPETLGRSGAGRDDASDVDDYPESSVATDFVNISVTPVECSIVCSKEATRKYFLPIINSLDASLRESVSISTDEFVAIQVDGEGLDAGQRVLDLTSPLALARM
jgi:hypothetical protein